MKMADYHTNRHSCYLLEYHLVVVTKYRHPVISGKLKERLLEISYEVIENHWNCKISEIKILVLKNDGALDPVWIFAFERNVLV